MDSFPCVIFIDIVLNIHITIVGTIQSIEIKHTVIPRRKLATMIRYYLDYDDLISICREGQLLINVN